PKRSHRGARILPHQVEQLIIGESSHRSRDGVHGRGHAAFAFLAFFEAFAGLAGLATGVGGGTAASTIAAASTPKSRRASVAFSCSCQSQSPTFVARIAPARTRSSSS